MNTEPIEVAGAEPGSLRQRFAALARDGGGGVGSPAARLRWRAGSLSDYRALARFHYLAHAPVTATRVIALVDPAATPADRWRAGIEGRAEVEAACDGGVGADAGRVVGVLVESLPALSCRLRDLALGGRYAGWSDRGAAARLLNAELRCISRVVVHPQWRGLGLAVALVGRALSTMSTPYTEALAAMGRVHPFFARAGMREYRRPPLARNQRLIDAMRFVGLEPWMLADPGRMRRALTEPGPRGRLLGRELRRWAGGSRDLDAQLRLARDRLLCEPVYYLNARDES